MCVCVCVLIYVFVFIKKERVREMEEGLQFCVVVPLYMKP